jgi:hypothetical protein
MPDIRGKRNRVNVNGNALMRHTGLCSIPVLNKMDKMKIGYSCRRYAEENATPLARK